MTHERAHDRRWWVAAALALAVHAACWQGLGHALHPTPTARPSVVPSKHERKPQTIAFVEWREPAPPPTRSEPEAPAAASDKSLPTPRQSLPRAQAAHAASRVATTTQRPAERPTPEPVASPPPPLILPLLQAKLPASQRLHFEVAKLQPANAAPSDHEPGPAATGQAMLEWSYEGEDRYRIAFTSQGQGLGNHRWTSEGRVDAEHGLQPERMAARSQGRSTHAVNLDHASQRAWFSGPKAEQALAPGAQDRLSWLVQLPAVLAADPKLHRPGAEVTMQVLGPRGEAALWRFVVQGPQRLALGDSAVVDALMLERLGEHLLDTDVKVWLDAVPPHLPWRWQWHLRVLRAPPTVWTRRVTDPTNP